jgi:hypothetical protein
MTVGKNSRDISENQDLNMLAPIFGEKNRDMAMIPTKLAG